MKNLIITSIAICILSFVAYASEERQATIIDQLFGNSHFSFEQIDQEIVVSMQKLPWEGFTFSLANEDFFNNPICRLQVKSYEGLVLQVELSDGETIFEGSSAINLTIEGNDEYQELIFDFTGAVSAFNATSQPYLIFYVNPGQNHSGEMMIKNIQFSGPDPENTDSTSEFLSGLLVYPNPATDHINIEMPENFEGKVTIHDITGREVSESRMDGSFGMIAKIDISRLHPGTYLVSLIGQSDTTSRLIQVN